MFPVRYGLNSYINLLRNSVFKLALCGGGVEYLHRGDEKGSLKSESKVTRTQERLRWRVPAAYTKDRPVLSSKRTPTKTGPQLSKTNKYLVVRPRWVLYSKANWPTDCRS
jgi:hypothetical protein